LFVRRVNINQSVNKEIKLLIKSKYPVIFLETIDEVYTFKRLKAISERMNFIFYHWSLTGGLIRGDNENSYYETKEPVKMLQTVRNLLKREKDIELKPSLFVLLDFEKYLKDSLLLRLFKDIINTIKGTGNTFIIVGADYHLPNEIEHYSAHLVGGYPVMDEIKSVIEETVEEMSRMFIKVTLSLSSKELNKIIRSLKGLSTQQIRNVINQCLLENNTLDINSLAVIETYKKKIFDREGLLEFSLTEDKNNIAGFNNLKRWLSERKSSFSPDRPAFLPVPRGLLLMGIQGCGKSLAVKVIAREFNLPLYRLDLSRLYSKYIGETERNLRKALIVAEKLCPICMWIDEIEKGFASSGGDVDGGVSQRVLGTFLTWMQEHKTECFIAATANNIYRLPPEFLRKGRFDEIFFVDLPDAESRKQLLNIHLKKRDLKPENFNLKKIIEQTCGFSGAEIEQSIISALYSASNKNEAISTGHIIEQVKSTKPLSILKKEEIYSLREWAKERTIQV
jgi:hypothetical protein